MSTPKKEKLMISKLRRWFLAGLLVSLPIIITFYIVIQILNFFDNLIIQNLFPESMLNSIPGIGLFFSAILMVLIGFIATNFLGQYLIALNNKILNKIPIIRSLYSLIKQVVDTVLSQKSHAFRDVVLLEYPRKGIWVLGFVTSKNTGEVQLKTHDEILNIFLPTTPNPTSGFLLFVPRKDTIRLDMPPEVAMKLIISGGVIDNFPYEDAKTTDDDSNEEQTKSTKLAKATKNTTDIEQTKSTKLAKATKNTADIEQTKSTKLIKKTLKSKNNK